ncbi:hypothetical protein TNCV_4876021 [Trichonephila clavipes]|uniref:Uncharacterized protein n=1 Tax=Trichonephila clavipes TaxID=2585209 RepID=A0A8X6RLR9_TRICX|nr:hypothetical protein TNCV_4876021 [Trichonephila clavipes]
MPLRHGVTLNNRRAASPLVRYVEGEESRKPSREVGERVEVGGSGPSHAVLAQNWCGTESNSTVTCMVLKTKANDRRKNLSHDGFRGP